MKVQCVDILKVETHVEQSEYFSPPPGLPNHSLGIIFRNEPK